MFTRARLRLRTELVVTRECLGIELPIILGSVTGRLLTPSLLGVDGGDPRIEGWNPPPLVQITIGQEQFSRDEGWGSAVPHDSDTYGRIAAFLLELEPDEDLSQNGVRSQAVHLAADAWLELLRQWAGARYNQYTGDLPRQDGIRTPGRSLYIWVEGPEGVRSTAPPPVQLVTGRVVHVLELADFRELIEHTNRRVAPPLELVLLAEARNRLARGELRQAVADAASAAELVLADHLSRVLTAVSVTLAKRVLDGATLGRLVQYADIHTEPIDIQDGLVRLRNGVLHRGETPNENDAMLAVSIADAIVQRLGGQRNEAARDWMSMQ